MADLIYEHKYDDGNKALVAMIEYIFNHFCKDHIYRAQTLKHKKRYQQK